MAEVVKASFILLYTMNSVPVGVGSNPTQGDQYFLLFLTFQVIFSNILHFLTHYKINLV